MTKKTRKPQERTERSRELLLRAAERTFAQVGYEKAQMEEIAATAGFSKGGLYAHFKSKEELFLALYEAKTAVYEARLRHVLTRATTREGQIEAFRDFYVDLAKDKDWALIILEVKLFMRRHPEAKRRLRQPEVHSADSVEATWSGLFGHSSTAAGEALGGIFPALVLEADLEPDVLSPERVSEILGAIFDSLARLGTGQSGDDA